MKKLMTLFLAAVIAVSAASCNANKENKEIKNDNSVINYADTTEFYGKVSGAAGNEIDLDLAKLPEAEPPVSMPEDTGDGMMASMTIVAAAAPGEGGSGGAAQRIEPDYTGETKSFSIPSGLEIKDTTGAVKQLSDIKKGTMLSIRTDKDNNIVEVLYLG